MTRTVRALDGLSRLGATEFVHCGDLGTPEVLTQLAARGVPFVWGNNDEPDLALIAYARNMGVAPASVPLRLTLGQLHIAIFHGHEKTFWRLLTAAEGGDAASVHTLIGEASVVLFGHTHYAEDRTMGGVRFVNPGALHRASRFTVATLDIETNELRFWVVSDERDELQPYELRQ
ncbi:MAG: metallophosphoesterase family protein [Phycisphaerales bacterium]|nr:metallophosphoesterase family protein [Phycisphaerales bacterium]